MARVAQFLSASESIDVQGTRYWEADLNGGDSITNIVVYMLAKKKKTV